MMKRKLSGNLALSSTGSHISHYLKRNIRLLLIGGFACLFASCSDDNGSTPPPENENIYTLELKSSQQLEFKEVTPKNRADVAVDETRYFGQRIKLACPQKLQFNEDSLSIVKANSIIEKYKIKWKDNELLLHNNVTDTWEYCGKKDADGKFVLNTGFYLIKSNSTSPYATIGQEYWLTSYETLSENDKSVSIVWLRMNYIFE